MADSEISRTLPFSTPQKKWLDDDPARESVSPLVAPSNILSLAADFLLARSGEWNRLEVRRDGGTPAPVRTLWKRWYLVSDERVQASRIRSALYRRVLGEAGHLPSIEIMVPGQPRPAVVTSFRGIKRLGCKLGKAKLAESRDRLRRRKRAWDEIAGRIGYPEAEAEERNLTEEEESLSRVLWMRRPVSFMEVAAKLHCLLASEDADSKNNDTPWPELRVILDDLVHLGYLIEERSRLDEARLVRSLHAKRQRRRADGDNGATDMG